MKILISPQNVIVGQMSMAASYIPLVNDIIVVIVSVVLSNLVAWCLDKQKKKRRTQEKSKELYKRIIDDLSSKEDKDKQTVENFDSFIKDNRHLFDPEFKKILPQSFDAFWESQTIVDAYGMTFYNADFRNLKGEEIQSNIKERISMKYYYFPNAKDKQQWEQACNEALKRYNALSDDSVTVDKWMFDIIPEQLTIKE